jgi:hypothetical protein
VVVHPELHADAREPAVLVAAVVDEQSAAAQLSHRNRRDLHARPVQLPQVGSDRDQRHVRERAVLRPIADSESEFDRQDLCPVDDLIVEGSAQGAQLLRRHPEADGARQTLEEIGGPALPPTARWRQPHETMLEEQLGSERTARLAAVIADGEVPAPDGVRCE